MKKVLSWLFAPTVKPIVDDTDLYSVLANMQQRIEKLEEENIGTTNALYELENRLEAKIDAIHPVVYNINQNKPLNDLL